LAIEFVGASAIGTDEPGAMPSYAVGDLIIVFSYRDGNTSPPSIPSGQDWISLHNATGANTNSHTIAYKFADSTSEGIGKFSSGTTTFALVYRGVDPSDPIGDSKPNSSQNVTPVYLALTLEVTNGTSWIVAFSGHRAVNGALNTTFDSFQNRAYGVDATDQAAGFDSNGGRSSFSQQSVNIGGSSGGWRTHTLELRAAPETVSVATSSGSATASAVGASNKSASASSAGVATASATGSAQFRAVATSDGVATASAVGVAQYLTVGTSAGTSTASATGAADFRSVGTSAGLSEVSGIGAALSSAVASAAGTSTASAVGEEEGGAEAVATATAGATVSGVGAAQFAAVGTSSGSASVSGATLVNFSAVGLSQGIAAANAVSAAQAASVFSAAGLATVNGVSFTPETTDGIMPFYRRRRR
jgi:hypothetical protein